MKELTDQEIDALSEDERIAYRKVYYRPVLEFLEDEFGRNEDTNDTWLSYSSSWFNDSCLGMSMKEMMKLYMKDR